MQPRATDSAQQQGRLVVSLSARAGPRIPGPPPPPPPAQPTASIDGPAVSRCSSFTTMTSVASAMGRSALGNSFTSRDRHGEEVNKPEGFSRVQAAVRLRPMAAVEEGSAHPALSVDMNGIAVVATTAKGEIRRAFDCVLGPGSSQEDVYEGCVADLVANFMQGHNSCVLAYGQTASGKTHTMGMAGIPSDPRQAGILPRAAADVFQHISRHSGALGDTTGTRFQLEVQFLEVYKEEVIDLLGGNTLAASAVTPRPPPQDSVSASANVSPAKSDIVIREGEHGEVLAHNAVRVGVDSSAHLLEAFERGVSLRSVGATAMNERSSRSHAIFTLLLTRTWSDVRGRRVRARSKLHLVDLAGSERQRRTMAAGQRLKESSGINSGLLALGKVVAALARLDPSRSHVPLRDSKLTRLLADSLGGTAATVLIACVAPDAENLEESLNTLQFASRARHIASRQEIRTELVKYEPASAEEEVYARLLTLLQREGGLSWQAEGKPTAEGLLACLTQDSVWQVLSNYRHAAGQGGHHLAALKSSALMKSQDIMGALMLEVQDGGTGGLLLSARGVSPAPDTPLARFLSETSYRDKQRMAEEDRASAVAAAAMRQQKARPARRGLFACFGI